MSTQNLVHSGAFHYDGASGTWVWSDQVSRLLGFEPGDVVMTLGLLLSHVPATERPQLESFWSDLLETGHSFPVWHHVVDAAGRTREVVTAASAELDATGGVRAAHGHLLDVSEALRRTSSEVVDEALSQIGRTRAPIEQAKGALMLTYGLDPDAAFQLLRVYSQLANVKVRDVARTVVDSISERGELPAAERADWDRLALATPPLPQQHPGA
ncbi:MAG: ANTAR domain-containing protein [Nocardioidaceae bacterium]